MKIDPQINRHLNLALGQSLISINQYFLHARILKRWGLNGLGSPIYKKSIQDMKEADELIERILLLEGIPNLQSLGKILIGEDVPEIISCDLKLEYQKRAVFSAGIELCESLDDFVSRSLLTDLLDESEEWIDFLEMQNELITSIGLENYLQSKID